MKDFLTRDLNIGDFVVIMPPRYREFVVAKIVAFTPKNVRVSYRDPDGRDGFLEVMQSPMQLIKIQED